MSRVAELIRGSSGLWRLVLLGGFLVYVTCLKSQDRPRMLVKWLITFGALTVFLPIISRNGRGDYVQALVSLYLAGLCGLVVALTWIGSLGELAARLFVSLVGAATSAPDPVPIYSIARARQKQGKYFEAVEEIRRQLSRFPKDVEGQLLLAEVFAENLSDLHRAQLVIDHFCAQAGHAPKNIVFALYSMADWHLAIGADPNAARRCLEQIIELLPDTEHSSGAAQRLAHLAGAAFENDPKKFVVNGVGTGEDACARAESSTGPAHREHNQALEYVEHLRKHPLDTEVRERLALAYADYYERPDLGMEQLEQMIQHPNQPGRNVVKWLNLLADIQIRFGADVLAVQATLQRIIDRDPRSAAARLARNRIGLLKLEIKGTEKSQAVKLGSYAQNLGLTGPSRHQL